VNEPVLPIVTVDWPPADGEKAIFGRAREAAVRVTDVGAEKLARSVTEVCRYVGTVFEDASTAVADLELRSLEVQLEVTSKGEVRLIGAASVEVKGGLKLVFARRDPAAR
jgi:hypothetical protein